RRGVRMPAAPARAVMVRKRRRVCNIGIESLPHPPRVLIVSFPRNRRATGTPAAVYPYQCHSWTPACTGATTKIEAWCSRLQLAFELVQKAPIGAVGDDLLRARFDEA